MDFTPQFPFEIPNHSLNRSTSNNSDPFPLMLTEFNASPPNPQCLMDFVPAMNSENASVENNNSHNTVPINMNDNALSHSVIPFQSGYVGQNSIISSHIIDNNGIAPNPIPFTDITNNAMFPQMQLQYTSFNTVPFIISNDDTQLRLPSLNDTFEDTNTADHITADAQSHTHIPITLAANSHFTAFETPPIIPQTIQSMDACNTAPIFSKSTFFDRESYLHTNTDTNNEFMTMYSSPFMSPNYGNTHFNDGSLSPNGFNGFYNGFGDGTHSLSPLTSAQTHSSQSQSIKSENESESIDIGVKSNKYSRARPMATHNSHSESDSDYNAFDECIKTEKPKTVKRKRRKARKTVKKEPKKKVRKTRMKRRRSKNDSDEPNLKKQKLSKSEENQYITDTMSKCEARKRFEQYCESGACAINLNESGRHWCYIGQCEQSYGTKCHLKRHCDEQHINRHFQCIYNSEECASVFKQKIQCKEHILNTHLKSLKGFKCWLCGESYTRWWGVRRHIELERCKLLKNKGKYKSEYSTEEIAQIVSDAKNGVCREKCIV